MSACRAVATLSLLFGLIAPVAPALGQQVATTAVPPSCTADWACATVRVPLGFYIDSVGDGGRYVTLEDGTIWEILPQDRAKAAAWRRDDFVEVRWLPAPIDRFEWRLIKYDQTEWEADGRLVGRRPPAFRDGGAPTDTLPAPRDTLPTPRDTLLPSPDSAPRQP